MSVFVLDQRKRPVMPCCEKRLLLERGRAVVHRRYPLTICLKDRVPCDVEPVRVKLDPGSRTTGTAVVADRDNNKPARVLCLFELAHRGRQISEARPARRAFYRRGANLRYRPPRFDNRGRPQDRPSLQHRADPCFSWRKRFDRMAPVSALMVRAEVPIARKAGNHIGGVAVRRSGSFRVGNADASNAKCCKLLHRADGDCYARQPALPPRPEERGFQPRRL
jgi:hypothetical protein